MADGVGSAVVPHGLRTTDPLSAAAGASRHMRPDPLISGLLEMMGTAGSVFSPHDPPNHALDVPIYAPLQHMPYPAYPRPLQAPPDGRLQNTVPAKPVLYAVWLDVHPCDAVTTWPLAGDAAAASAAATNRNALGIARSYMT